MSILARLINLLPPLALIASFPDTAKCGRTAVENIIHHLRLLIRKTILLPIFANIPAENLRYIVLPLVFFDSYMDDFTALIIVNGFVQRLA